MVVLLTPDLDRLVEAIHQVPQLLALLPLKEPGDVDTAVDDQHRLLVVGRLSPDLSENLVTDRGRGSHKPAPIAVSAILVEDPSDRLSDPLAGHLHQAELRDAKHVGLGLVA